MNAVLQFLSYSYQDIKPPRELNDDIINTENYGKLKYPDLQERILTKKNDKEIEAIMKRVPKFQNRFAEFKKSHLMIQTLK